MCSTFQVRTRNESFILVTREAGKCHVASVDINRLCTNQNGAVNGIVVELERAIF